MSITAEPALEPKAEHALVQLESRVEGVRNRSRLKLLSTGLFLSVAVFVFAFLGFSGADILFKLSIGSRVLALLSAIVGIGVVIFYTLVKPWQNLGGSVEVARNVENAYPELEEQLSTALEYGRDTNVIKTSSPALVGALMEQTAQRAQPLDFSRTIRWKPAIIALLIAFGLGAIFAGYAKLNGRLFDLTLSRFLRPTDPSLKAPTLTEIKAVLPGNTDVPVETALEVSAKLDGRTPDRIVLSVFVGDEKNERWEERPMDRGEDGLYRASLHRLLESTRYKVIAGDDESAEFRVNVFKLPEVSEFALRLEYPAYSGRSPETLAPGTGDVRALKGTTVNFELKANTDLSMARAKFKSGRQVQGVINTADPKKASVSFKIEKDDEYQIELANTHEKTSSGTSYLVKSLKDHPPRVVIRTPEKDLMVHREQTVTVDIVADDDVGVTEIGLYHSMELDEKKVMIRKMDPALTRAEGKLVWELSTLGLKGGEVIAYYAYAIDNNKVDGGEFGGQLAKSEIHFLTVYDEQDYNSPKTPQKQPPTPKAVKQLDKLIDIQKKLLKETFAQANQQRDPEKAAASREADKTAALKTAEAQKELRGKLADLLEKVKADMAAQPEMPEPQPADGGDSGNQPKPPPFGDKELKHMETAVERMSNAEDRLKVPNAAEAVKPETEALRHLSETRRLLLSDQQGNPRFKMAMNKQAKKKHQQEQDQQQQDQQDMKDEQLEMPKMMDREKQAERELEELTARQKKQPPPPGTPEAKAEQEKQRQLAKQAQDELQKLAKDAEERARKLEQLASRNPEVDPAAQKMQNAADKLDQAAREMQQPKNAQEAKDKAQQAAQEMKGAQRDLRNATEKQLRQELANLQKDAQDLAQRQQDVAQQAKAAQREQQGQPKEGQKPDSGQKSDQPKEGQKSDQGQPKEGQKSDQGQPKEGQKSDQGQPKEGQKSDQGQPQEGQPKEGSSSASASGQSKEQQMRAMSSAQRDIQSDLKDLGERLDKVAEKAQEKGIAGAKDLDKARQQAGEKGVASQSASKAEEAMQKNQADAAQREATQAAKALDQMASSIQNAVQNTAAGDMKELASAMKKLQGLAKAQDDINKDIAAQKKDGDAGSREEQVAAGAEELSHATENLEALRKSGRDASAREKLDTAAQQAHEAADALKKQDTASAKAPGEKTSKALNDAMSDIDRAVGKTLEEKAREAKAIAKSAKENQDNADSAAREMKQPDAGEKLDPASAAKRDEAAAKEMQASREAKKLDSALEGLKELAKDANPAAADAAKEARDQTEQAQLPKSMEDIAKGLEQMGDTKTPPAAELPKTPKEAAEKGEKLSQVLKNVDKNLDAFIAEAMNSQLDRLRSMEQAAREAAKQAQEMTGEKPKSDQAQNDPNQKPGKEPGKTGTPEGESKNPDPNAKPDQNTPEQRQANAEKLEKELKRLQSKVEHLEPNAPEIAKMRNAVEAVQQMKEDMKNQKANPSNTASNSGAMSGGPAMKRVSKTLDEVTDGLVNRIERILRAREVKPDEEEDAPKEYRALVDKYYRALSEDVEEEAGKPGR
jgi:hypothetical protein